MQGFLTSRGYRAVVGRAPSARQLKDEQSVLPSDLVNRRFPAPAPRRLWVCDVTYLATWPGFACVAFVTDVCSRRIVGWNVAATLRSEIRPCTRSRRPLGMLVPPRRTHLSRDHGLNYTAMVYTERIVELGAVPSTGTVGDSFDNAMAEAINNLYKTELIRRRGPWRTVKQVELATLDWVWSWNNSRLHGELDMRTPIEVENASYADLESAQPAPAGQGSR